MKITFVFVGLTASLLAFFACDSKYNIIEAFLQNGAETKLFTYEGYSFDLGESVAIVGAPKNNAGAYVYVLD